MDDQTCAAGGSRERGQAEACQQENLWDDYLQESCEKAERHRRDEIVPLHGPG